MDSGRLHGSYGLSAKTLPICTVNAFHIAPLAELRKPYFELFCCGRTLKEIDSAFRLGKISPYDVGVQSINYCVVNVVSDLDIKYFAAFAGRIDVFQYLDSQGIGVSSLKAGESVLEGFRMLIALHAFLKKTPDTTIMEGTYRVMDYIAKKDVIDISTLQAFIIDEEKSTMFDGVNRLVSLARHICKAMKDEENELEQGNYGCSRLAYFLNRSDLFSLEMARILLDCGANAHGIFADMSMLSCAVEGWLRGPKTESCREVLEERFCLLISAGVDVNHVDKFGSTTSNNARNADCWDEWCRALERNNLNIDEVLEVDKDRQSLWMPTLDKGIIVMDEITRTNDMLRQIFWPSSTKEELVDREENAKFDEERWKPFRDRFLMERSSIIEKFGALSGVSKADRKRFWLNAACAWAYDLAMEQRKRQRRVGGLA